MMSEVQGEAEAGQVPAVEVVAPPSVGQRLRAERERQGLSIHDVAQRLKYAPRQIEAVETDDFKSLPGLFFLRCVVYITIRMIHCPTFLVFLGTNEAEILSALAADGVTCHRFIDTAIMLTC